MGKPPPFPEKDGVLGYNHFAQTTGVNSKSLKNLIRRLGNTTRDHTQHEDNIFPDPRIALAGKQPKAPRFLSLTHTTHTQRHMHMHMHMHTECNSP